MKADRLLRVDVIKASHEEGFQAFLVECLLVDLLPQLIDELADHRLAAHELNQNMKRDPPLAEAGNAHLLSDLARRLAHLLIDTLLGDFDCHGKLSIIQRCRAHGQSHRNLPLVSIFRWLRMSKKCRRP